MFLIEHVTLTAEVILRRIRWEWLRKMRLWRIRRYCFENFLEKFNKITKKPVIESRLKLGTSNLQVTATAN